LPADVSASELNHLAVTLLSLYRGPYSDGNDEAWLLSGRNRWRNRFLEGATALGLQLEKCNALAMANTLYLRALEVEPLAETMYRNLMRCAHAQNDPSAAFSAYRRCRETLSVILGKRPSPETEKLAMSIGLIEGTGEGSLSLPVFTA
jgi:DNA-binding SARP family transcriptional activator